MSIYSDMPAYEAAEVMIKALDQTSAKLLDRAAEREFTCDFCASIPGETCRFSTWKTGVGSAVSPHFARRVAAVLAGWSSVEELANYGPLKEKVTVTEPIDITIDNKEETEEVKKTEIVSEKSIVLADENDGTLHVTSVSSKNYAAPCEKCGKPIPKSGMRGRPPRSHAVCP